MNWQLDWDSLSALMEQEGQAPRQVLRAMRREAWSFPAVALSILERDGVLLSTSAAAELQRYRNRHQTYAKVLEVIGSGRGSLVVKGPAIAHFYPDGVLRHVGDLDIAFADEEALWNAITRVRSSFPVEHVDVTYFGSPRQLAVNLRWTGDDEFLDGEYIVDMCTTAFPGDENHLGPRPVPQVDDAILSVLAICEERFQRPFRTTDVIDAVVLGPHLRTESLLDAARETHLTPELAELYEYCDKRTGTRVFEIPNTFNEQVITELASRESSEHRTAISGSVSDFDTHLLNGGAWHGYQLDGDHAGAFSTVTVTNHWFGPIIQTPVGVYLAVTSEEVDLEAYEAAQHHLASQL